MPKDKALIERIRPILSKRKGFSEKRMFGGVCFILNGNMCVGTWQGSLIVRLDKWRHEQTLLELHTKPFDITGRVMKGWALVERPGFESDDYLTAWVDRAVKFAAALPAK